MADTNEQAPGFLDLPTELRNKIYESVLNEPDTNLDQDSLVCPFILQCSPGKRKYGYSLTQTCHQIRQETFHMWHASSKLLFAMRAENMKYYITWLRRRPEEAFPSIRRIQLEDYQHSQVSMPQSHASFCKSAIVVNLNKRSPVSWKRDRKCRYCPVRDHAVDRVEAVVRTAKRVGPRWVLTREKLEEIFEAAAATDASSPGGLYR